MRTHTVVYNTVEALCDTLHYNSLVGFMSCITSGVTP